MKKTLRTLIVGIIFAFIVVIAIPLGITQNAPSPQPTPPASQPADGAVRLEGETLFVIQTKQVRYYYSYPCAMDYQ